MFTAPLFPPKQSTSTCDVIATFNTVGATGITAVAVAEQLLLSRIVTV